LSEGLREGASRSDAPSAESRFASAGGFFGGISKHEQFLFVAAVVVESRKLEGKRSVYSWSPFPRF
jgi:hypothetical protein